MLPLRRAEEQHFEAVAVVAGWDTRADLSDMSVCVLSLCSMSGKSVYTVTFNVDGYAESKV